MKSNKTNNNGWSYEHGIGVISVEEWGNPFLVVTDRKYWQGQSWGYNYFKLGVEFDNETEAKKEADRLNSELNIAGKKLSSKESESFLLMLQQKYPLAQIAK